jgi:hypothetical protein
MTNEEILKGNKLIKEFLIKNSTDSGFKDDDILYFHLSWDLLMSVVEVIESDVTTVKAFTIAYNGLPRQRGHECYSCEILPVEENAFNTMFYTSFSKIECVWFVVVKYIKWYNEQVNQNA